jgi:hypothetical protein
MGKEKNREKGENRGGEGKKGRERQIRDKEE